MAEKDDKKAKAPAKAPAGKGMPTNWEALEELAKIIAILMIIAYLLGRIGDFLTWVNPPLVNPPPLSVGNTPIGTEVVLSAATKVYDATGKEIGMQPAGAKGTIVDGPIWRNGERWWFVDFENGPDGWVPESVLKKADGSPFDPGDTPVGSRVKTDGETNVLLSPGGDVIGTQPPGARGTVVDGPISKDGIRYWYVDFDTGVDGWIAEDDLRNADGSPFSPGGTPVGRDVFAIAKTDVHRDPAGEVIGSQPPGARGTVLDGPVFKDGKRWWYVDFENPPDGWVSEDALTDAAGFDPGETSVGERVSVGGDSPIGDKVITGKQTAVFVEPGGASAGTQPAGAKGMVVDGPKWHNGERYWYVDFENGPDGWVPESALRNAAGGRFNPGDTPIGTGVSAAAGTSVLSSPGGVSIGTQPAGAKGTITDGPVVKDGVRYWYVDFATGPDGWVAEGSLRETNGAPLSTGVTDVYGEPGGALVGSQMPGAKGTVAGGPIFKDGERWWYVDFDTGTDGWVRESQLKGADGGAFTPSAGPIGTMAMVAANTTVHDAPAGAIVGGQPAGAKGVVSEGPIFKDGKRWWYVDFENGPDGWVSEDALLSGDGTPFNPGKTPIGSMAEMKRDANVYDDAGNVIGRQEKGSPGTVIKGPIWRDGQRYWYVDFEDGPDGWVAERDLLPYQEPSAFAKTLRFLIFVATILLWVLTGLMVIGIGVMVYRINKTVSELSAGVAPKELASIMVPAENAAWKRVVDLSESENPSDWKLAIIEADAMLDKMLRGMGYPGDTVGERLKAVERSDFTTLDLAWEAHKVRNRIAHEGGDFLITSRETRRIVALYKNVFTEFRML